PVVFVEVERLPLTANGKLDRGALPDPSLRPSSGTPAPRATWDSPLEREVAGIWAQVLGAGEPDPEDDFLDLGGDSLLATRVLSRVRAGLGLELPGGALFTAGTVRQLAGRLRPAVRAPAAPPAPPADPAPALLSHAQRGFWLWWKLDPASGHQNLAVVLRVRGELDPVPLAAALDLVAGRHELLRASFRVGAHGVEQVAVP